MYKISTLDSDIRQLVHAYRLRRPASTENCAHDTEKLLLKTEVNEDFA